MKKRVFILIFLIIGMFFSNTIIAAAASTVDEIMNKIRPLVNTLKTYYEFEDKHNGYPYDVNILLRYEASKKVLKNMREEYYTSPETMAWARSALITYKNNNKDLWYPKEDGYIDREIAFIDSLFAGEGIDLSKLADRNDILYTSDGTPIIGISDAIQGTIYTDDSPKAVERGLSELLNNTSTFLMTYLKKWGADIDTLVYNSSPDYRLERRTDVNGMPFYYQFGSKSFFMIDFEDTRNSPFSNTAIRMYYYFQYFAVILMASVLLLLGIRIMSNGITKNKVEFKQTASTYLFSYVLIFAFPYIMKIITIFMNQFVSTFRPDSGNGSFVGTMAEVAVSSMRFGDALLYLGCVGISVYFLFVYASRALHIMLFYALFPIMVMFMNGQNLKDNFQRYIKDFFATLFVQVIDAILFWSVSMAFRLGGTTMSTAPGLIKIFVACSIITVRGFLKNYLSEGRSAKSEIFGIASLMGIASLVSGVARGVGGSIKTVAGGVNDFASSFKVSPSSSTSTSSGSDFSASFGQAGTSAQGYSGVYQNASTIRSTGASVFDTGYDQGFTYPGSVSAARIVKSGDGKYSVVNNESQEEMLRKLRIQGLRSIGRGIMSLAGGGIGASMGAGIATYLGPTAMIHGANIGSSIGYGIGSGIGNLAGFFAGSAYNAADYFAHHKPGKNIDFGFNPESQSTDIVIRESGEMSVPQKAAQSMANDESKVRVYTTPYEDFSPYRRTVDQYLNDMLIKHEVQNSSSNPPALPEAPGLRVTHTHDHNVSAAPGDMTIHVDKKELNPQSKEFKDACYSNYLSMVGDKNLINDFNASNPNMSYEEKFREISKRAILQTYSQCSDEYSIAINDDIIYEISSDIKNRLTDELRYIRELQEQIDADRFADMDSL